MRWFELETRPSEASLLVDAEGDYEVYINGVLVHTGKEADPPAVLQDVTQHLLAGRNTVAVWVVPSERRPLMALRLIAGPPAQRSSPRIVTSQSWYAGSKGAAGMRTIAREDVIPVRSFVPMEPVLPETLLGR